MAHGYGFASSFFERLDVRNPEFPARDLKPGLITDFRSGFHGTPSRVPTATR